MFRLLKKLFNMLLALPKKLVNYAFKHPYRVGITVFVLYMCCSDNIFAVFKDLTGINGSLLSPKGKDVDEEVNQEPEMDDISMYKDSQLHTSLVAEKSAELEDLVNTAMG